MECMVIRYHTFHFTVYLIFSINIYHNNVSRFQFQIFVYKIIVVQNYMKGEKLKLVLEFARAKKKRREDIVKTLKIRRKSKEQFQLHLTLFVEGELHTTNIDFPYGFELEGRRHWMSELRKYLNEKAYSADVVYIHQQWLDEYLAKTQTKNLERCLAKHISHSLTK